MRQQTRLHRTDATGRVCVARKLEQDGRDTQGFHASVLSPSPGEAQILPFLQLKKASSPWTLRSLKRTDCRGRRDEAANPRFGCRKIAEQMSSAFGIEINKHVVRRILIRCYRPVPGDDGPSWLTVIGHAKDSLWSVDFFRCESIPLKSYWIMIVMDVFTRRIIGFGVAPADLNGPVVCRMFNRAIAKQTPPKHLSSDNVALFRFHRWRANLRILEVDEIKTIPCTPVSHTFVERPIGTVLNISIGPYFVTVEILNGSSTITRPITTNTAVTPGWPELLRLNGVATRAANR